jgi:hypothetical protein
MLKGKTFFEISKGYNEVTHRFKDPSDIEVFVQCF